MIKAFLFDIGNVIVDFDFSRAGQALREHGCFPGDPIEATSDLRHALEIGAIDGDTFTTRAIARIGFEGSHDDFVACYQDIFTPNTRMWSLIEQLAEKFPLYLLSNTSDLHHAGLLRDFPVFQAFQSGVFSYRAKSLKPDSRIFATALRELPIEAESTLYFDDLPDNIAAGKRHGLISCQYDSATHTECLSFLAEMT